MSKTEFLEVFLGKELERLETVEHVSDLANNGRYAEVDAIVAEIDYTALDEYMQECNGDGDLEVSEIPEGRYLAFVICLSGSDYDECQVMKCWRDLQEAVRGCGEVGEAIAALMEYDCVNSYDTFAKLVRGESNGDDEADGDCEEDEEEPDDGSDE